MIAATEEERFTRVKHWAGFPVNAIRFCLRQAGVFLRDVDHIAIGRDPKAKLAKKVMFLLKNPGGGWNAVRDRLKNARQVTSLEDELVSIDTGMSKDAIKQKISQVEHHRSHLASAFFASPYEEAALLSIDGSGDFTTTMTGVGRGNQIEVLNSVDFPHSAGLFYSAFTQLLGFPHYGDEFKVMGLAAYGKPLFIHQIRDIVRLTGDGLFRLNLKYFTSPKKGFVTYDDNNVPVLAPLFSRLMVEKFGLRRKSEPVTQYHKDLAASVQQMTEELIFHILWALYDKTGLENVCIAGGVAQNSVANGKIIFNTPFKQLYIPSAGHDAGICMGAAMYVYNHLQRQPRAAPIYSAYTGSSYTNQEIEECLRARGIDYTLTSDDELFDMVVSELTNAKVVGWFSGPAEFGPRALGARSIIADPRNPEAKELINLKIKRRENFRPFAPSILKEYAGEYFDMTGSVPFMEKVFPIKWDKQSLIPAVTHVDGTGRLQTVDKAVSPRYYRLIDTFRQRTGIPVLLNTSFNENEPIVNSPAEALECFLRNNIDMLVLENCVVRRNKPDQPVAALNEVAAEE